MKRERFGYICDGIGYIPLTQGQVALVDVADFAFIDQWQWCAMWSDDMQSFYAHRGEWVDGKQRTVRMHREILGLGYRDPRQGDHRESGQTLDNRRSNLRIAVGSQNQMNSRTKKSNKSGFKGVWWSNETKKWAASIRIGGKTVKLGYFLLKEEAYAVYCAAAKENYGEFARFA